MPFEYFSSIQSACIDANFISIAEMMRRIQLQAFISRPKTLVRKCCNQLVLIFLEFRRAGYDWAKNNSKSD
jgi:hypothetical protein